MEHDRASTVGVVFGAGLRSAAGVRQLQVVVCVAVRAAAVELATRSCMLSTSTWNRVGKKKKEKERKYIYLTERQVESLSFEKMCRRENILGPTFLLETAAAGIRDTCGRNFVLSRYLAKKMIFGECALLLI